jgi:XTP/dITP diphosphohydrolase
MPRRAILFATSNPHKLREAREILEALGVEVLGLDAFDPIDEPNENGDTFEANARIKALAYAAATNTACVAEDSGLEVDALGGAPGTHSARYAAVGKTREERDEANNAKLLEALRAVPDERRTARFVCALCFAEPDGEVAFEARRTYEGRIVRTPRGTNGFAYDPLLEVLDQPKTSAELTREEKHRRSHRGAALRALAAWLG